MFVYMARLIGLCFVSLTVKRYSVRLYLLFSPVNISINLFFSLLPLFSNTLTKELLTYCICVYIKEKEMGFAFVHVSILHFVSPAWLSVIKERMWLNFPRLGFACTVVYTVQKSFYTSKFFLFLIFFHLWRMIPSRARRCYLWCFKCPFPSYICAWNLSLWNRK